MCKEMLDLAARVEAASGPDRELDADIAIAIRWRVLGNIQHWVHDWPAGYEHGSYEGTIRLANYPDGEGYKVPEFTASLDSAMSLIPQGAEWKCEGWPEPSKVHSGASATAWVQGAARVYAATPALALCAAALRARAQVREAE